MKKKVLKNKDIAKNLALEEKVKKGQSASRVDLLPDDGGGILNKKSLDAKSKAQKIIDEANSEAEKVRAESQDLLAQVGKELEETKKRGFEEGKEKGLSSVTEMVTAFELMKETFYNEAEENIVKLVMTVAEKVIGKIASENEDSIKSIVTQALESSLVERILVRLNPKDFKVVKSSESEFKDSLDRTKRIIFKEDEAILQGGCVVETEVGTIDARLETQLKAIKKALEL